MECSECAAEVVTEAVFCHHCGHRLSNVPVQDRPRERFRGAVASLDDDTLERELWQGKFSKLAMIGSWAGAGLFSLVLLLTATISGFSIKGWGISLVSISAVWLALLLLLFYRHLSEHYYLTDRRFIHERGLLWREIDRIEAIDIDDVSFQQGPVERILGVGTIRILSSDNSHPQMELPGIEKVREVAEMIDEVRRQERLKRGLYVEAV